MYLFTTATMETTTTAMMKTLAVEVGGSEEGDNDNGDGYDDNQHEEKCGWVGSAGVALPIKGVQLGWGQGCQHIHKLDL